MHRIEWSKATREVGCGEAWNDVSSPVMNGSREGLCPSPENLFLPRDVMRKRGLCCRPVFVRPSVRPSVTLVYCIQTAEDIVKFLSQPDSPMILVFLTPSAVTQFPGNPFGGGAKYTGVGKFCDFRLKSPSISETVRDRSMIAMER